MTSMARVRRGVMSSKSSSSAVPPGMFTVCKVLSPVGIGGDMTARPGGGARRSKRYGWDAQNGLVGADQNGVALVVARMARMGDWLPSRASTVFMTAPNVLETVIHDVLDPAGGAVR